MLCRKKAMNWIIIDKAKMDMLEEYNKIEHLKKKIQESKEVTFSLLLLDEIGKIFHNFHKVRYYF